MFLKSIRKLQNALVQRCDSERALAKVSKSETNGRWKLKADPRLRYLLIPPTLPTPRPA